MSTAADWSPPFEAETDEHGATHERFLLKTAEAVALVTYRGHGKGARLYVMCGGDARIVDEEGKPTDQCFRDGLRTSFRVSVADAKKITGDLLSAGLEGRGARVSVRKITYPAGYRGHGGAGYVALFIG